eukprot:TRINITY_DN9692_c0_g2_i12.p1 TRINITY_DN9692_c0_g2~~TRINITY_DN9692_c0_g2_i12.p1  ORF type:complete len:569 (-),score=154.05 TRINITY_DN9692_c0_g2_i12:706-2412(-)
MSVCVQLSLAGEALEQQRDECKALSSRVNSEETQRAEIKMHELEDATDKERSAQMAAHSEIEDLVSRVEHNMHEQEVIHQVAQLEWQSHEMTSHQTQEELRQARQMLEEMQEVRQVHEMISGESEEQLAHVQVQLSIAREILEQQRDESIAFASSVNSAEAKRADIRVHELEDAMDKERSAQMAAHSEIEDLVSRVEHNMQGQEAEHQVARQEWQSHEMTSSQTQEELSRANLGLAEMQDNLKEELAGMHEELLVARELCEQRGLECRTLASRIGVEETGCEELCSEVRQALAGLEKEQVLQGELLELSQEHAHARLCEADSQRRYVEVSQLLQGELTEQEDKLAAVSQIETSVAEKLLECEQDMATLSQETDQMEAQLAMPLNSEIRSASELQAYEQIAAEENEKLASELLQCREELEAVTSKAEFHEVRSDPLTEKLQQLPELQLMESPQKYLQAARDSGGRPDKQISSLVVSGPSEGSAPSSPASSSGSVGNTRRGVDISGLARRRRSRNGGFEASDMVPQQQSSPGTNEGSTRRGVAPGGLRSSTSSPAGSKADLALFIPPFRR